MPPDQAGNPMLQMIPLLLVFLIFYFLVMKPEKEKQKAHKARLANLQKNDMVVFSGGIHGTIVNVKPTTVTIRVDDNVKIEVDREAITTIKAKEEK